MIRSCNIPIFITVYLFISLWLFTSDNGGDNAIADVCLSVCLSARLLKNVWMDLDEMLLVDRRRDVEELINF